MTIEEMKARKKELGLSNEKIAQLSKVPIGTVQKIFSGETRTPRYNTICKLEAVFREHQTAAEYGPIVGESFHVAESLAYGIGDYYCGGNLGNNNTRVPASRYVSDLTKKRIGIAAGKFKVPDDSYFYDDEIADMFEEI